MNETLSSQEPLLPSNTRSYERSNRTPPQHAFLFSPTHNSQRPSREEEDIDQVEQTDAEPQSVRGSEANPPKDVLYVMTQFLGRPFASKTKFWWQVVPVSLVMGALLGSLSFGFLACHELLLSLWFHGDEQSSDDRWKWLIVTSLGGFLSGFVLLLAPNDKRGGSIPTFDENSKGDLVYALTYILSSLLALASGSPLGDEVALGVIGSAVACLLARLLHVDQKTCTIWTRAGVAAGLGVLVPSPLLAILLVHELGSIRSQERSHATVSATSNQVVSPTTGSEQDRNTPLPNNDIGSHVEQISISACSTIVASLVTNALIPDRYSGMRQDRLDASDDNQFETWHWAAAMAIGVLCGVIAVVFLVVAGVCGMRRRKFCRTLQERWNSPRWMTDLLFPTFAGVATGLIAVRYPFIIGNQFDIFEGGDNQLFPLPSSSAAWQWTTLALSKGFVVSIGLGFGVVGGPALPMVFAGKCFGLAISSGLSWIPSSLSGPCCVAAFVGALIPAPLTIALVVAMEEGMTDLHQVTSVLISTVAGQVVSGGLGIAHYILLVFHQEGQPIHRPQTTASDPNGLGEDAPSTISEQMPSDYDILQDIRSAIFGNQQN